MWVALTDYWLKYESIIDWLQGLQAHLNLAPYAYETQHK